MATKRDGQSFWIKETFSGGTEYRTRSKVVFAVAPFLFAALLYKLLTVIEGLASGPGIILVLAYGVIVVMTTLMLLVIIVSIIEYLRRYEK